MDYLKKILLHKKNNQPKVSKNSGIKPGKFASNFSRNHINIIGEIKQASPSRGKISYSLDKAEAAKQYGRHSSFIKGVSVLTEPLYFKGYPEDIKTVKKSCQLPVLRKDFIIYPSQVYESAQLGADCILLIASLLGVKRLKRLHDVAIQLGLEVLVEVHNRPELDKAMSVGAKLIGINNRNLKTLGIDKQNAISMIKQIQSQDHLIYISESGISNLEDIMEMYQAGVRNFLVGTYFMRAKSLKVTLDYMERALKARELI
ncbi:MAG: indole-3-glycerol phosphate synthase TrpC [Actinomycetia bacterium]|nr:indole-3-glycerol phosphate synthase TrpC [Actinomycetes bacterium]